MSSFVATGGAPAPMKAAIVRNNGWWPDIDSGDIRASHRITDTITSQRLESALIAAIASTNRLLQDWQRANRDAGHVSLDAVPVPDHMPPEGLKVLYLRAVYCEAHAQLVERYRDYDATGVGVRDSSAKDRLADDLRRDAAFAISDICDRPRNVFVLI